MLTISVSSPRRSRGDRRGAWCFSTGLVLSVILCGVGPTSAQHAASAGDEVELAPSDVAATPGALPTIEIPSPPGAGGFEPRLAVQYKGSVEDGVFGVGWSLNLGEIRRSERFGSPSYDDSADAFELDDQILVYSAATERYHTFVESFHKIEAIRSGPVISEWIVTTPDGTTARYGGTSDSVAGVSGLRTRAWLVSQLEDRNGNQIRFEYSNPTGTSPIPSAVRYTFRNGSSTQGPERRLEFLYETRPDPVTHYAAGLPAALDKRVREIQITVGGEIKRRIVFSYAGSGYATLRSRLVGHQVFGDDCTSSSTSTCIGLPATTYTYTDPADSIGEGGTGTQWESGSIMPPGAVEKSKTDGSSKDLGWRAGDIDGDGRFDLVQAYQEANGNPPKHEVWLGTGAGFVQSTWWSSKLAALGFANPKVQAIAQGGNLANVVVNGFQSSQVFFASDRDWGEQLPGTTDTYLMPGTARLADVNGDGRADIVVSFIAGAATLNAGCQTIAGTHVRQVWLNNGSGWQISAELSGGNATHGLPAFQSFLVSENLGGPEGPQFCGGNWLVFENGAVGVANAVMAPLPGGVHFADLNGDRKLDATASQWDGSQYTFPSAAGLSWGAWLQTDSGFVPAPLLTPPVAHNRHWHASLTSAYVDNGIRYVDMNGDGKQDLVHARAGGGHVWLSTGETWVQDDSYLPPVSLVDADDVPKQVLLFDANSDGLTDVLRADGVAGGRAGWLQSPGLSPRWQPDDRFKPLAEVSIAGAPLNDNPDRPYRTRGVLFGDFDGNGTPDFIRSYLNGTTVQEASVTSISTFSDLLSEVDNGRGGYVKIDYVSLVAQKDASLEAAAGLHAALAGESLASNPDARLGYAPLPVIERVTTGGIGTGPFQTAYRYAHPRWDARLGTSLGIRLVEEERHDGSIVKTFTSQIHGRVGRLAYRATSDESGVKREEGEAWEVKEGSAVEGSAPLMIVGRIAESWSQNNYPDGGGARRSRAYQYNDVHGFNFISQIVDTRPTGTLVIDRTPIEPADTEHWIVRLIDTETRSSNGVVYSQDDFDYAPGRPLLSARKSLVQPRSGGGFALAEEIFGYDGYGNLSSYRDAESRVTQVFWEGDGGPCAATAVSFALRVGMRDPKGGVTCFERDSMTGQVKQQTAFNNDITTNTLNRFGQVVAVEIQPFSESSRTLLETRDYEFGTNNAAGQPFVSIERFVGDGTSLRTARYQDGLGHDVREVSEGSLPGQWIGVVQSYDYAGRILRETLPQPCSDEHCSVLTGNESGTVTSYDVLGRLVERVPPSASANARREKFDYRRVERAHPPGSSTTAAFDGILAMDPNGHLTQRVRDGNRLVWVDECDNSVSPGSALGSVPCSSPAQTFYGYEPTGEIAAIFDAVATGSGPESGYSNAKHRTLFSYDTLGRRLTIEDSSAGLQRSAYDLVGNVTQVTNARNEVTVYHYDELDRTTNIDRPGSEKDVTIWYDDTSDGGDWTRERARVEEVGGYTATYHYDALRRLAVQTQTTGGQPLRIDYEYDLVGRATRIRYPDTYTQVVYEYAGPYLRRVCDPGSGGVACAGGDFVESVQYDPVGRPTLLALPPGDLNYSYEAVERRLEKIRFVANVSAVVEELELTYGYDGADNITAITDGRDGKADGIDATATYGYDERNRLEVYDPGGVTNLPPRYFRYDVLGNLVGRDLGSMGDPDNQTYADTTRAHALTSVAGGNGEFEYDADGSLERLATNGYSHTTDSQNRLVCVGTTPGGCEKARVEYDIDGNRIFAEVGDETIIRFGDLYELNLTTNEGTGFIFVHGKPIAERRRSPPALRAASTPPWAFDGEVPPWTGGALAALVGSALLALAWRARVHERLIERPLPVGVALSLCITLVAPYPAVAGPPANGYTANRWLLTDHLGSVVAVVTAGGAVVRRRVFEPFGEILSEGGTEEARRVFAGHEYAAAMGLYDFGARWYVPAVGRFASVDPLISLVDPQQQNAFSYAANNPVRYIDPTGMFLLPAFPVVTLNYVQISCDGSYCAGIELAGPPPPPPPPPPSPPLTTAVQPGFLPIVPATIVQVSLGTAGVLAADDATVVLVVDNVLIPFLAATAVTALAVGLVWKAVEQSGEAGDRSIDNPSSLEGATPEEVEAAAEEAGFTDKAPLRDGNGTRLSNPNAPGRTVQINKGYPGGSGVHGGPYVKVTGNGPTVRIPLAGNPTLP